MLDRFKRKISYLRISVTDRCNFRCTYCMPARPKKLVEPSEMMTPAEIGEVVRTAVSLGFHKIRLTGGEPVMREDIVEIVGTISKIEGVTDFGMTTNGTMLEKFAEDLKSAGLKRINVSLDSVDEEKFREITGGELKTVLRGLDSVDRAGFQGTKINIVVEDSSEEKDAVDVSRFAEKRGYRVRFIRKMDLKKGKYWIVEGGKGGNCGICDRIRLTCNGFFKPCLFSDLSYDIRTLGIENALRAAVENKPEYGVINRTGTFYNMGG